MVIQGVFKSTLGVVIEFDVVLVLLILLLVAESLSDLLITLVLLTFSVALNSLLVAITSTSSLDVSAQIALTVKPDFCLAWNFGAGLVRMARCLAPVDAVFSDLVTSHAASFFQKLFLTYKALAGQMAVFGTGVAAGEGLFALGTTG